MTCDLCGSSHVHPWKHIREWRLVRCHGCGVGMLHPPPTDADMRELYNEAYFASKYVETQQLAVRSVPERIAFLDRFQPSGSLLDIGCGTGGFLAEAAQRGWQVKGIEVSPWAAEEARLRHGLDVITESATDADFPEGAFDVITFWDALEHLPQPGTVLRRCRRWLKPDGILIIRVVNCRSYDARMLGTKWRGWAVPYHLFHFSPHSLRAALRSAGFEMDCLNTGVSTVLFRFLIAPIAFPSHHAKLIQLAERCCPGLCERLRQLAHRDRCPGPLLRRLFPGPVMDVVARPR